MGRPAKAPEKVRSNRVVVMVTDDELSKLQRIAEREERPLGTVAYKLLAGALKRKK